MIYSTLYKKYDWVTRTPLTQWVNSDAHEGQEDPPSLGASVVLPLLRTRL